MLTVAASIFSVSTVSLKMVQEKKIRGERKKESTGNIFKEGKQEGEAIKFYHIVKSPSYFVQHLKLSAFLMQIEMIPEP